MARLFRLLLVKRQIDRSLRLRKAVRQVRSEAARRGHSTEIANRAARAREVFGQ